MEKRVAELEAENKELREDLSDARAGWEQAVEAVRELEREHSAAIERAIRLTLERAAKLADDRSDGASNEAAFILCALANRIRAIQASEIMEQMKSEKGSA